MSFLSGYYTFHYKPDDIKITLDKNDLIGDAHQLSYLLPGTLSRLVIPDSNNPNLLTIIFSYSENFQYLPFKKEIFILLLEFLINEDDPTNLISVNQKFQNIIKKYNFNVNLILIFLNIFDNYPNLIITQKPLYQYFKNLSKYNQPYLINIKNQTFLFDVNFAQYYQQNLIKENKYQNFIVKNEKVDYELFSEFNRLEKVSYLGKYLMLKINSVIDDQDVYHKSIFLFQKIYGILAENIFSKKIGEEIILPGFQAQSVDYNVVNYKAEEGIILKINYPANFKYLPLANSDSEIWVYANSKYRLIDKYVNYLNIICELEYLNADEKTKIKVTLPDFDNKFLTFLQFFDDPILYRFWLYLYYYFLTHLKILDILVIKLNFPIIKLNNLSNDDYLENFEYIMQKLEEKHHIQRESFDNLLEKKINLDHISESLISKEIKDDISEFINELL